MKPNMKIGSFLLAVIMILTAVFASGCVPISLKPQWSYKTADKELPIGVYIYSLDVAYSQAKTFASKQVKGYSDSDPSWLDKEITDDDDNKEIARKWIKDTAETMCLSYLAVEQQLKEENAQISTDDMAAADKQAETYWNVGQYADYGYVMPMSKELEPYGISLDSFKYCTTEYSLNSSTLLKTMYGKGGSQEVSDSDLTDYFTKNYVDYSYVTANLYNSETDDSGQSMTTALSEEDAKKITDEFDGYAKDLNGGASFDDVMKKYMDANMLESDPSTSNIENLESTSLGTEVVDALKKLDNNHAATVKVGDGDSAVYYLVYKRDINKSAKSYIEDENNRLSVLNSMKSDDFKKFVKDIAKEIKHESNTSVLDRYDPKMFFVKPEPTTAASDADSVEGNVSESSSTEQ